MSFTRAEVELRLAAFKRTREVWRGKGGDGYGRLVDLDIWALELALQHLAAEEAGYVLCYRGTPAAWHVKPEDWPMSDDPLKHTPAVELDRDNRLNKEPIAAAITAQDVLDWITREKRTIGDRMGGGNLAIAQTLIEHVIDELKR